MLAFKIWMKYKSVVGRECSELGANTEAPHPYAFPLASRAQDKGRDWGPLQSNMERVRAGNLQRRDHRISNLDSAANDDLPEPLLTMPTCVLDRLGKKVLQHEAKSELSEMRISEPWILKPQKEGEVYGEATAITFLECINS